MTRSKYTGQSRPTFRQMRTELGETSRTSPPPPRAAVSAGQFAFVLLDGRLMIACPACHAPVDPGGNLGSAWSAAKLHRCAGT